MLHGKFEASALRSTLKFTSRGFSKRYVDEDRECMFQVRYGCVEEGGTELRSE